ncbi:hypothetical protein JX266_001584 [Neoarthrinium moseri]|nr:hypothetical protein JX266_001584 [Neoarthrinium moseri]
MRRRSNKQNNGNTVQEVKAFFDFLSAYRYRLQMRLASFKLPVVTNMRRPVNRCPVLALCAIKALPITPGIASERLGTILIMDPREESKAPVARKARAKRAPAPKKQKQGTPAEKKAPAARKARAKRAPALQKQKQETPPAETRDEETDLDVGSDDVSEDGQDSEDGLPKPRARKVVKTRSLPWINPPRPTLKIPYLRDGYVSDPFDEPELSFRAADGTRPKATTSMYPSPPTNHRLLQAMATTMPNGVSQKSDANPAAQKPTKPSVKGKAPAKRAAAKGRTTMAPPQAVPSKRTAPTKSRQPVVGIWTIPPRPTTTGPAKKTTSLSTWLDSQHGRGHKDLPIEIDSETDQDFTSYASPASTATRRGEQHQPLEVQSDEESSLFVEQTPKRRRLAYEDGDDLYDA